MYIIPDRYRYGRKPARSSKSKCPFCDPDYKPRDPWRESQCVLNKPLMMVIPPGGVHLDCPVHPEGHHVFGSEIHFMSDPAPVKWDNNLPDPANKPTCDYDMTYRPDRQKFRM